MLYRIRAKFIKEKTAEFLIKLTDGSIEKQKPDGQEIVASMQRAKITAPGVIEWSETCYCPTPLAHERETVYDHFLSEIQTEEISSEADIKGDSFWDYLIGSRQQAG
jgi:hypothetical protein